MIEFRDRLSEPERRAFDRFVRTYGEFGGRREERVVPLQAELRDSGDPDSAGYYVRGHGTVFKRKSLDLGGFQEMFAPTAFDDALDGDPDVHLLWDHDMRYALARTRSQQYLLELRTDPKGLHYYAKVAPTAYAADLRVLMDGGVIDQASIAFTVADDIWEIVNRDKDNEYVLRTITKVDQLYDVTITAQGAYPQTDSSVVRAYAHAYAEGRSVLIERKPEDTEADELADETPVEERGAEEAAESVALEPETATVGADGTPVAEGDPQGGAESRQEAGPEVKPNLLLRTVRMQAQHALDRHRLKRESYRSEGTDEQQGGGSPPAA